MAGIPFRGFRVQPIQPSHPVMEAPQEVFESRYAASLRAANQEQTTVIPDNSSRPGSQRPSSSLGYWFHSALAAFAGRIERTYSR